MQITDPRILSVGSLHIFDNSHTCVIMLHLHITLRIPTQMLAVHTSIAYTFFLQLVPSSLSVNNPLCPVNHTCKYTGNICMRWKKGCETQGRNCCWLLVCNRASFQRDHGPAASARKHTHTHAATCVLCTFCLGLRLPLFTKGEDCFMCV